MQRYISGPSTLRTVLCLLQDGLDRGFKTIYAKAMEERVPFDKDVIKEYEDTIEHYKACYPCVTENHHKKVTELVFPQDLE